MLIGDFPLVVIEDEFIREIILSHFLLEVMIYKFSKSALRLS
jgi:hypothetical protein